MQAIANIFRIAELRNRLLFTLGMLAIYRVGIFITTPGVDRNVMHQIMAQQSGTFLGMFNLFSGRALFLEGLNGSEGGQFGDVVIEPGWSFRLITIMSLTTGTTFIMWLGEQITE